MLFTDMVEAVVVMFGCGNDVLAVLIRESVVEADTIEVGNGWTELLPDVSNDDMMLWNQMVSFWTIKK